jgi:hypothetical protein
VVAGFASLLAVGCNPFVPRICTLVGCGDSLRVTLQPSASLPYRVTLSFPAGQKVAFQCTSAGVQGQTGEGLLSTRCDADSFTVGCSGAPSYCSASPVAVELTLADGTRRARSLTPSLTVSRPNGPGCEPACAAGEATLP